MKRTDLKRLARLQAMAEMQRDAELAKLAAAAQSRARLLHALDGLTRAEAPLEGDSSPGLIRARLAHLQWAEGRRRMLNQRLALVNADYLERRPEALRAFGRAQVLAELTARAKARTRQGP